MRNKKKLFKLVEDAVVATSDDLQRIRKLESQKKLDEVDLDVELAKDRKVILILKAAYITLAQDRIDSSALDGAKLLN